MTTRDGNHHALNADVLNPRAGTGVGRGSGSRSKHQAERELMESFALMGCAPALLAFNPSESEAHEEGAPEGARGQAPKSLRARWDMPLEPASQLSFWRDAGSLEMARALYLFVDEKASHGEPRDVWGWRFLSFLRRHCDAVCSLRDFGEAKWSAARFAMSLDFDRVVDLSQSAPEPHASGLKKYLREVSGSRLDLSDETGRAQAFHAHGALTMQLSDKLSHLSRFEPSAVAAGQSRLPRSMQELRSWVEMAELMGALGEGTGGSQGSARAL